MITSRHSLKLKDLAFLWKSISICSRSFSSQEKTALDILDALDAEEDLSEREARIEKSRNKSRLYPNDYIKQHGLKPIILTENSPLWYKRKCYGRLGKASDVNPSCLWPSKEEISVRKEYESVLQPFTIQELIARNQERKKQEAAKIAEARAKVLKKVSEVKKEIIEFHKRIAAEKAKAELLLEKKNKLIEKVRNRVGYAINEKDEKFKRILSEIQAEEKKKLKKAKKEAMEKAKESLFQKLLLEAKEKKQNKEQEDDKEN